MASYKNYYSKLNDIEKQIAQCDKLQNEWEEHKKGLDRDDKKRRIDIIIAKLVRKKKKLLKQYERLTK